MADLPDFSSRQRALLKKCDEAYAIAEKGRSYVKPGKGDKPDELHSQPDSAAMIKCIELAARLLGVIAEAEKVAKSDENMRDVGVQQLLALLRSLGYTIIEPNKAA